MSAALAASVGETHWSTNAFTTSPLASDSTIWVAKVFFAPLRPLKTTATRATAQSGTSISTASSPARLERA